MIQESQQFARYKIIKLLGQGGMGKVYKAYDPLANREVALKVLLAKIQTGPAIDRFLQEAKVMASLKHPHIINIYDIGKEDNVFYFTMELIDGFSLRELLKVSKLDFMQSAQIIKEVAKAIAYAHEQGIVHRDLKPDNIMITKDQKPIIMDFGLAKVVHSDKNLSKSGVMMGTLTYMAPEQVEGQRRNISAETDIYALGAIFYYMLTSKVPHPGRTNFAMISHILCKAPVAPRKINPQIPVALEKICLKALQKEKEHRYNSGKKMAEAISFAMQHKEIKKTNSANFKIWGTFFIILIAAAIFALKPEKKIVKKKAHKKKSLLQPISQQMTVLEIKKLPIRYYSSVEKYDINMEKGPNEELIIISGFFSARLNGKTPKGEGYIIAKYQNSKLSGSYVNGTLSNYCHGRVDSLNGSIVFMGHFTSNVTFQDKEPITLFPRRLYDGFIAFYDDQAQLINADNLIEGNVRIRDFTLLKDKGFIVVGHFFGENIFGKNSSGKKIKFVSKEQNAFIVRYSEDGKVVYARHIKSFFSVCVKVALVQSNEFLVMGNFGKNITFGTKKKISFDKNGLFVAKYSIDGDFVFAIQVQGVAGKNIVATKDKGFLITGYFRGEAVFGNIKLQSFGKKDIFVAKFDKNGKLQYAFQAGGKLDDAGNDIVSLPTGGFLVTGYFQGAAFFFSADGKKKMVQVSSKETCGFIARYLGNGTLVYIQKFGKDEKGVKLLLLSPGIVALLGKSLSNNPPFTPPKDFPQSDVFFARCKY